MEAISTSVPSINLHKIHPKPHHFHHLKPPLLLHHPHLSTSATAAAKPPTSISKTKPPSPSHHHQILQPTSQPTPPRTQTTHRHAATGYAAALVDAALRSNSLEPVHRDVKRLLKWLNGNEMLKGVMADRSVEEGVKGGVVKEVAEKAGLRRQVVAMVRMLVAKSRSGMVGEVMEEFERIYSELNASNLPVVV
ncbi:hypothetical protein SSX86_004689 [Deinandra increscens subsp. villosa]|uniref:Uncharacterized protein n=1 Tax=Deinandra increscens subsp. villosa TaxID=3103831 RepID=A0AAP0DNF5_9ASTR